MTSQKTRILVTGAGGQLGQCFQAISKKSKFSYTFLDRSDMDITDADSVSQGILFHKPDILINCAAYTAVDKAETEKDLAYLINEKAVTHLAKACKETNVLLIHFSTDYVYNILTNNELTEDDMCNPDGIYAQSKRAGELAILDKNIDAIIIRTSWVYSEYGHNFVKTMLRLFENRDSLNVVNDQIGTPSYAIDIAEVTEKIISHHIEKETIKGSHIYNFSNEGKTNWAAFAQKIASILNSPVVIHPIPSKDYPTPAPRPLWSLMSKTKIKRDFNVSLTTWEQSLKKCMNNLQTEIKKM